jgi:5'-3' exonuclease
MSKSFQTVQQVENTVMIVDALNLAFRWKHQGSTDFLEDYVSTVDSLRRSYKARHVIIAADQGSSSYRKALYPDYKQNRKDKYEQQTPAEKEQFELFFKEFQATLDYIASETTWTVLRFAGVEADDIAAYLVSKKKQLACDHIWLISSDRDWDTLVSTGVSRFSYVTRKEITADNWHEHYDCEREEYISIKCLMGDSGDNIPGVAGIGPKRAAELVKQWGSAWDIIANLPLPGKQKFIQALNTSADTIQLNYQLMDLVTHCREAIGSDNINKINIILALD